MTLFFTPVIEKILTPAYTFTINQLFSTGSAFTQFISNLFYSRISEGVYINISFYIFIVIISLILIKIVNPCIPRNLPCDVAQTEASCQKSTCQFSQRVKCLFIDLLNQTKFKQFSFITLYIVFIFLILTTNFINKTITQTMNNIEIVSPYISDYDYKMLKSNYSIKHGNQKSLPLLNNWILLNSRLSNINLYQNFHFYLLIVRPQFFNIHFQFLRGLL